MSRTYCLGCRESIDTESNRKRLGIHYCDRCYNIVEKLKDTEKCIACRKHHEKNNIVVVHSNGKETKLCKDCHKKLVETCSHCGMDIWKNNPNTKIVNGKFYCKRCEKNQLVDCHSCQKRIDPSSDGVVGISSFIYTHHYCEDCAKNKFARCEHCGDFVPKGNISNRETCEGKTVSICGKCEMNLPTCSNCKKIVLTRLFSYEYQLFCSFCKEKLFMPCRHCGDLRKKEDNEESYCKRCVSKIMIKGYGHKPFPKFHDLEERQSLFIGVELEIMGDDQEKRDNFMFEIFNNPPFFYFKYDGSIDNSRGMEIVSHPGSYRYHTESGVWRKLYDLIAKHRMIDTRGCGLHFHVSREGFENQNSVRLLDYFVNNNTYQLSKIGGRDFNRFCIASHKSDSSWGMNSDSHHYESVNLTNSNTVEIRFCSSTACYNDFMKRLNLIHNLVLFVNQNSEKNIDSIGDYSAFEAFVEENRKKS